MSYDLFIVDKDVPELGITVSVLQDYRHWLHDNLTISS